MLLIIQHYKITTLKILPKFLILLIVGFSQNIITSQIHANDERISPNELYEKFGSLGLLQKKSDLSIQLKFSGSEENEIGYVDHISKNVETSLKLDDIIVKIDSKYFRPSEVDNLIGSPQKAIKELGWKPEIKLRDMIKEMVNEDMKLAKNYKFLKQRDQS